MIDLGLADNETNHAVNIASEWVTFNPSLSGKDILRDTDLSPVEIESILETAAVLKRLRASISRMPGLPGKRWA
jgi:hypothetical protein